MLEYIAVVRCRYIIRVINPSWFASTKFFLTVNDVLTKLRGIEIECRERINDRSKRTEIRLLMDYALQNTKPLNKRENNVNAHLQKDELHMCG